MNSDTPFSDFKSAFDRVVSDEKADDYIVEVTRLYLAIQGQAILDLLIGQENFTTAHQIIDDCQKMVQNAFAKLTQIIGSKQDLHFLAFQKSLQSNFERYRGIVFLKQGKNLGAIRHIFKAIRENPFFPYNDYEQYKEAFNKTYIANVGLSTADVLLHLGPDEENKEARAEEQRTKSMELLNRTEFIGTPSYEDILKEIMARDGTKEIHDEVEKILWTDFCAAPICSMIRGEVLKYIPKGEHKYNALYLERIPEALSQFEQVLAYDEDFLLMYTRIGILKFIAAIHTEDEVKANTLLREGMENYKKGDDIRIRLGMH